MMLVIGLGTSGCSSALPYDAWFLGFGAPSYMEVWIDTADVLDINHRLFRQAGSGTASVQTPSKNRGKPAGWPARPGMGAGKYVTGADLPKQIFVRWQSLVELKTYAVMIDIPEAFSALMVRKEKEYCPVTRKVEEQYRKMIAIGLAPGGVAKVWIMGPCLEAIEVARVQGQVSPIGPFNGAGKGYYELSDISKAYIEQFGVPYDSW